MLLSTPTWKMSPIDLPSPTESDAVLALPSRAQLFALLCSLKRPAGVEELAEATELHPNGVRIHLERLRDASLLERSTVSSGRGRPHHEWTVAADAMPGGRAPVAYRDLARWLGRAIGARRTGLRDIERQGREIGREIAPTDSDTPPVETMHSALAALGFAPRERKRRDGVTFELGNCPYRDAVGENQPLVCTLHRGISRGLLDQIAPEAKLADFVAKDPYRAGCLIAVDGLKRAQP